MIEKTWSRHANWVGTAFEDTFIMINLDHGQYVSLNPTATDVWNAIETPATIPDIVGQLTARYDVPAEHCRKSVAALLDKFTEMGLISSD